MRLGKGLTTTNAIIVSGTLDKEPECSNVGAKNSLCVKLNIRTESKKLGDKWENTWDTVTCWREIGAIAKHFHKGDILTVFGVSSTREYNGKEYLDITADCVLKMGYDSRHTVDDFAPDMEDEPF